MLAPCHICLQRFKKQVAKASSSPPPPSFSRQAGDIAETRTGRHASPGSAAVGAYGGLPSRREEAAGGNRQET